MRSCFVGTCLLGLSACSGLSGPGYLWQSIAGHLDLMRRAEPIDHLLRAENTDSALKLKLVDVQKIRRFASTALALPDNGSYTRYAALRRPYVMWNVFAAPALSLQLRQWCFPVAGCVSYRGYFRREDAERYAQTLANEGFDTQVSGVPAYSTLGWFDDPVPSTIMNRPRTEIARLVFHELAHQVVYLPGDSTFNESFASAVEEAGVQVWLASPDGGDPDSAQARSHAVHSQRRHDFLALLVRYRSRLHEIYQSRGTEPERLSQKHAALSSLRADYRVLREQWGGYAGYDRWFERPLGNAHLAAIGTYTDLLPAFRRILHDSQASLPVFYAEVRRLAKMPEDQRRRALEGITRSGLQALR